MADNVVVTVCCRESGIRLAGKFAELILTILVMPEVPVGVMIKFFGKLITADLALALLLNMPKRVAVVAHD
ncbi:hypothetical protein BLA29_003189 [Euroglyphus maynei]|uniref:Uncharacterized protein n=1 Tax=Euroglyphus maynei TaxID=6958 RepID=A0A1Y3B989_EURMA|nr:hypothetical protein BLA29_003189 [Euroglyphus maynei]